MIEAIIRWSVGNRFFVLLAAALLVGVGLFSLKQTPLDALPDLSDVQVIIKTSYPGQAPQVVEDQVTYPLTTAMLSVPGAVTVRGFSFFGDSLSILFLMKKRICTGREVECLNISVRLLLLYRKQLNRNWDQTQRA